MNSKRFHNQTAIVTGAGQGIGFEICRQLALQGANVILNDREETLAVEAATAIRKEHGICEPIAGDVSDPELIKTLVKESVRLFGQLNIAIANAGITLFGDFLDYTARDFDQVMQVNQRGTFFLAQAAAQQMKDQSTGGSLLFMSSVTGHQAHKNLAAYSMSKAAIEMLAKALVAEVSAYKINVNAIAPGATLTQRTLEDKDYKKTWSALTPLGMPNNPVDIANAALFLVSPEASHITGQCLIIDGGWTSMSPSPY